jgi:hypothetical protein
MPYTITLTMPRAVLSLYSDSSQVVVAGTSGTAGNAASKTYVDALDGEFRVYAAGRVRLVTTPLDARSITLVMRAVTDAQMLTLQTWRGLVLVYRDWTGEMQVGSYTTCTRVPIQGAPFSPNEVWDVGLDWRQVSAV